MPIRMRVDRNAFSAAAPEQLVERHTRTFGLDVPESDVYCGNGAHRHWPTTPITSAIKKLPGIFDAIRIAPNEEGNNMLLQRGNDRPLAAGEGPIANAIDPIRRRNFERHKVSPR